MADSNFLKPQIGLFGAVFLGLGSILGTGVFVSLAIATSVAGSGIFWAIGLAAATALCNGLSAAQLAAAHPVSGGTYAYGYRYLSPWAGFIAGWLFLLAKSASAATAALGLAKYFVAFMHWETGQSLGIALLAVLTMTTIAAWGIQRSNRVNTIIVSFTLVALLGLITIGGIETGQHPRLLGASAQAEPGIAAILEASALMFVAYTGYGRITTMTEEVHQPQRTIPIAVVSTLLLTMLLYMGVAMVMVRLVGFTPAIDTPVSPLQFPPLQVAAAGLPWGIETVISIAAITAMLGVLLNLILGLSRVLMAMGRQGDMPKQFARLNPAQTTPTIAVWGMGIVIAILVSIGNVKTTWSFSAFNVLAYYSLTNLAALRLPTNDQLYPRWTAVLGLISCATLAFWVEPIIWQLGVGLIAIGVVWKGLINRWNDR